MYERVLQGFFRQKKYSASKGVFSGVVALTPMVHFFQFWRLTILKWKFSPRVYVNINLCTNWCKLLRFGGFLGFSLLKLRNIFRYKQFVSLVMSRDSVFEKHQAQTGFSSLEILKKQKVREYQLKFKSDYWYALKLCDG